MGVPDAYVQKLMSGKTLVEPASSRDPTLMIEPS
jgi:hypothetical protein